MFRHILMVALLKKNIVFVLDTIMIAYADHVQILKAKKESHIE